jgi:hypothetical protein
VKGGWREEGERVRGGVCTECESESDPKPRPKPKPSSADVAERGVASIGVRSSGNLCVEEEYVKGKAGAHSTTPTYTVRRDCEGAELVGVLVAETIHPACMCEGGGRWGERGGRADTCFLCVCLLLQ